ncbi:MAG: CHAT domain-containing protein [Caldilineaceae bacterium]|nr:CHAT domain-containing protein [Caldilineaceae bacterium]
MAKIGSFLFDKLLTQDVGTLFASSLNIVRAQGARLALRLRVEPPELAALPWELLYNTNDDSFLAISAETTLVRTIPLRLPVRPLAVTPPLRVLVVVANPHTTIQLDIQQEKQLIHNALSEQIRAGRIQLETVERATVAAISEAMRSFRPHVFHFVGHGLFVDDRACVVLEQIDGSPHLVDERDFRELFNLCQETRLAVLNACQTASISVSRPLSGIAPHLLQRQLSAVVAMQAPITDRAAQILTQEFYQSLAHGYPVDAAISEARKGIYLSYGGKTPDWAAPVLYLRARDGQLFAPITRSTHGESAITPPPEPIHPPPLIGFVGRQFELAHYAAQLQRTGIAVIAGMAGVGKTSLAAALAQQVSPPERIFWHPFRPEEGPDVLIWKLAGFLAWNGKSDLWAMLQGVRQRGGQLPPVDVLFDYLFQTLRGQEHLICLDDFQYIDEDPLIDTLVDRITRLLGAGKLALVITSRRRPGFLQDAGFQPLGGLGLADVTALVKARGLTLTDDLIVELHKTTGGNGAFLTLAIDALHRTDMPHQLLTGLAGPEHIEHYLLNQLDKNLEPTERDVLSALAVLDDPSTREAIEAVLDGPNVRQTLYALDERFLLVSQIAGEERAYSLHAILAAFYYEQPSRRQRQAMHRRAAEYYETDGVNEVRAALHFQRAGEIDRAVALATGDVLAQINQGRIQPLRQLLELFTAQQVNLVQWAALNLARGQVYTLLQEREQAKTTLQASLSALDTLPDTTANRKTRARVCRLMGALLRSEAGQEAISWVQRGLTLLDDEQGEEAASLHLLLADIYTKLGDDVQARQSLDFAVAMMPPTLSSLRIDALIQLSNLARLQGDHAQAVSNGQEAIRLAEQSHDYLALGILWGNLAIDQIYLGEWHASQNSHQRALALAEQMGDVAEQIRLTSNLGSLYRDLGDDEAASRYLFAALEQARNHKTLQEDLLYIQCTLADYHLRRNEVTQAMAALQEATSLANELQIIPLQPYIQSFWALAYLGQGEVDQAQAAATQALALAHGVENPHTLGTCLRTQGQVLLARGAYAEALDAFAHSAELLADDPYEAARTKLEWGRTLASGANAQAAQLLAEAGAVFERLGARREAAMIRELIIED